MSQQMNLNDYYPIIEAGKKLPVSDRLIYVLIKENRLKTFVEIDNQKYVSKKEIDEICALIDETYSFVELYEIIKEEIGLKNITKTTVKNHLSKYYEVMLNPLDRRDWRFYKKDKDDIVHIIKEKFRPLRKENEYIADAIDRFSKEVLYLGKSAEIKDMYDFEYLFNYVKNNCDVKGIEARNYAIKNILRALRDEKIVWYTNKEKNNIYIKSEDFKNLKQHYEELKKFNPDNYYTSTEVTKILDIATKPIKLIKYCNAVKHNGILYLEKEKIDELKDILEKTVSIREIVDKFDLNEKHYQRVLDRIGIETIPQSAYPLFTSQRIYKSDLYKIEEYLNDKDKYSEAETFYDRFLIDIKEIPLSKAKIKKTIEAYDLFVQERLNENQQKYLYTNLVNVYRVMVPALTKELMAYKDEEVLALYQSIPQIIARREFSFFMEYCKERFLTKFKITIEGKIETTPRESYTFNQWKDLALILFTEHDKWIPKSLDNRTNAMVWLYFAMHYVTAWRADDICEMPRPELEYVLGMNELEVIECIKNDNFTLEMAQNVVNDVKLQIEYYAEQPGKHSETANNQILKFEVSESYVYTIGMLIALCEAHRMKLQKSSHGWAKYNQLITKRVTKREPHIKMFGKAYEDIFGSDTFLNTEANKTYMGYNQSVSQKLNWGKGYDLGAIIRGHMTNKKTGIAHTTERYLTSFNKGDEDIDKITEALVERGSFGFNKHLLMIALTSNDEESTYELMSRSEQNRELNELLGLDTVQSEAVAKAIAIYSSDIKLAFQQFMVSHKKDIKDILIKLSMGEAPGKSYYSQCLLKTVDRSACAYPKRESCVGCEYQIKETYFLLELNQKFQEKVSQIKNSATPFDRNRYMHTLMNVYVPILGEAIRHFGQERVRAFVKISKREIKKLQEQTQKSIGVNQ